ncbi:tyrosine-type recombinase/integrase [Brevibacillus sp. AY1]|nr:tyrosine-type recombinase/integrase [Brevibacillus sp. AY1]
MPDSLVVELERYLHHPVVEEWRNSGHSGHSEVFFENNRPLTKAALNRIIKNLCLEAGIQKTVTAHSFRHTTAYLMQSSGIDIIAIKRQLRHKQLSTTLRYVPPVDAAKLLNDACSDLLQ